MISASMWKQIDKRQFDAPANIKASSRYRHRLTEAEARAILALRGSGKSEAAIGAMFNVAQGTVNAIFRGRTWTHLQMPKDAA